MRSAIRRFMVQTLVCALFSAAAVGAESKSLQIFFVDVEGGQADFRCAQALAEKTG